MHASGRCWSGGNLCQAFYSLSTLKITGLNQSVQPVTIVPRCFIVPLRPTLSGLRVGAPEQPNSGGKVGPRKKKQGRQSLVVAAYL